ncbi:MAG: thermonuclease family protein [Hyphomicrobiaceae bacterium]
MKESGSAYATFIAKDLRSVALALAGGLIMASGFATAVSARIVPPLPVVGAAEVVDGDTIDINGQRIRLEGIDAPEKAQECTRRLFGTWQCGKAATKALRNMVQGKTVTCERRGTDKYGRILGVCFADGIEINRKMVQDGNAWAFVKYSDIYAAEESEARSEKRGVFATENQPPWDYRTRHWVHSEQQAPAGCAIKGNVTRSGSIYHMPWSPFYSRVVIDAERGERWFCSEQEALAAGWRPAGGS